MRLAIEPSLRTDVSFVHTLRDGIDVAERAGIDVVADLGNCWMERNYEESVRRAGSRIAAVQFADAVFGTPQQPPPGGRAVPGDGDLPISRFFEAALDAGYTGLFELEQVGPRIEAEGHGAALRRGVERASALLEEVCSMSSAIVFNGDETWEERDVPVPDPQPGGAVLRVEATGLCHSDVDHFRGHVHTSWEESSHRSPATRSSAGSRRSTRPRPRVGSRRGRPSRGPRHGLHSRRVPDLRP